MRPNFELLRDAFAIIDGIPEHVFDLEAWTVQGGSRLSCGTIACAGGWLARHPKFVDLGLDINNDGDVCLRTNEGESSFGALSKVFSLYGEEEDIFMTRRRGYRDGELSLDMLAKMTDKQLWKRRVLRLFQEYSEPFDPKVGEGLHLDARRH
ncbi:hypothetical protein [Burkholderia vietnamiensis]|uniref:hypothetical protein n=1 Tax=Burkholderia vietnamiensis TaxID=60552 RepID=UPI001CB4F794|nr:hypothetical protein [Burkholderia vietnamiensis]CAG9229289.1 conserved hypothetical protein [Burkholderia vietnamiensis]HDR9086290.1 hypothetical protein [Burkholderia vietnamiensis]